MKKIITLFAGLLLMISSAVFAEEHAKAALEHANAAVGAMKHGGSASTLRTVSITSQHCAISLQAELMLTAPMS